MNIAPSIQARLDDLKAKIAEDTRAEQTEIRQVEAWREAIGFSDDRLVKIRASLALLQKEYDVVCWTAEQAGAYFAPLSLPTLEKPQPPEEAGATEASAPSAEKLFPEMSDGMLKVYAAVSDSHPLRAAVIAKNTGFKPQSIGCYLRALRGYGMVRTNENREWVRV